MVHAACNIYGRVGLRRLFLITFTLCCSGDDRGGALSHRSKGMKSQQFPGENSNALYIYLKRYLSLFTQKTSSGVCQTVLGVGKEFTQIQILPHGCLSSVLSLWGVCAFPHKWKHKTVIRCPASICLNACVRNAEIILWMCEHDKDLCDVYSYK